ncbi:SPW repeat domain-containing protein [Asanoa ferruginea]|nr:SPW repeat protein [Asanoa ferruginea]
MTRNGTAGNGMAGNGMAGRHATDAGSYGDGSGGQMADGGYGAQGAPMGPMAMSDRVQQTAISAPNALLLIAGIWLILSRFVFDFPLAGSTAGGVLNGVVIGIAVAIMALVRMSAYRSNPMINLVTVVAGAWMMASPWAFGYPHFGSGGRPGWSDIIVGGFIIFFGLLGAAGNLMRRRVSGSSRMSMMSRGGGRLATR